MKNRPRMLSATFVRNVNLPGRYGDGRGGLGLSLLVKPASRGGFSKSWSQSVRLAGKPTSIGLGRYPVVTLAMARERALENARAIAEGRDPRRRTACSVPTFAEACETVIAIHAGSWKPDGRTEKSWRATLRDYALPGSVGCPSTQSPAPTSWTCCCPSGSPSATPRALCASASAR